MARPTTGVALLDKYEGDPQSIRRVQAVIDTLAGKKSVKDACQELGICEAMFRRFRDTCLQAAISSLDPQKPGRKPIEPEPGHERIAELEQENQELKTALLGAVTRMQLAAAGCLPSRRDDLSDSDAAKKKRL